MKARILGNDFNRIIDATKQFCDTSTRHKEQEYIRLDFDAETPARDGSRLRRLSPECGTLRDRFL